MPRNRGRRVRVETGIYRDNVGFAIVQTVGDRQREIRLPHTATRQQLRDARGDLRAAMRKDADKRARSMPARGTLAAAAVQYLAAVRAMPSYASRRRQIEMWVGVLGHRRLVDLTHVEIARQLQIWLTVPRDPHSDASPPYAPQYVIHLRGALSHLYRTLMPDEPNPVDYVKRAQAPNLLPRAIPVPDMIRIIREFPWKSKSRARLAVMATTGLGQRELMRIRRQDVDLEAAVLVAHARRKGQGAEARTIPLTRHAVKALRLFASLNCWGEFSTSNLRRDFRLAATRAGYDLDGDDGLDWRPYDARHTFLTELGRASKDERAVQEAGGHADIRTTRRYTLGSASTRVAAAVAALDGKRKR
jgi:integrase